MKTYHKCDFCHFLSEDMEETRLHEHACNLKNKLGFLGVEISHETARLMWDMCLVNLSAIDANHAASVALKLQPDDAFGHPGMAQQLWICPDAGYCKVEKCIHKTSHNKTRGCGVITGVCPGCDEVKK